MGNLKEAIELLENLQEAKKNEDEMFANQETAYERFFRKPPTVETYYSDVPGSSKHQNTRKPKPRKNVKHGNRKKK